MNTAEQARDLTYWRTLRWTNRYRARWRRVDNKPLAEMPQGVKKNPHACVIAEGTNTTAVPFRLYTLLHPYLLKFMFRFDHGWYPDLECSAKIFEYYPVPRYTANRGPEVLAGPFHPAIPTPILVRNLREAEKADPIATEPGKKRKFKVKPKDKPIEIPQEPSKVPDPQTVPEPERKPEPVPA